MKNYMIWILLGCCFLPAFSQSERLQENAVSHSFSYLTQQMDTLTRFYYQEKIFLQTDRSIYHPNDTIWYKAWVMQAGTLLPTQKSRLLYVDLINEANQVKQRTQYTIRNGMAYGQFYIPKVQEETGFFRIRAYTRWQKNFGDSAFFERVVPVWSEEKEKEKESKKFVKVKNVQGVEYFVSQSRYQRMKEKEIQKKEKEKQDKAILDVDVDIQFLPEGGNLVEGIPNRIAFKSLFPDGSSANLEGMIVDSLGNEVVPFSTIHKGMGSFILKPDSSVSYRAKLVNGQEFQLPKAEKEGINMLLSKWMSDTIIVVLNATQGVFSQNKSYYLSVESRGLLRDAYSVKINRARTVVRIPKNELSTGVQRFTLFTNECVPICERLFYVDKRDEIRFDLNAQWQAKSDTEKVMTIKIKPQSSILDSIRSVCSVSVTNAGTVPFDTTQSNLLSEMLLSSELKGHVEEPGYYFCQPYDSIWEKLDLVMLTHGWRGYNWSSDLKRSFEYHPDTGYSISGKVLNLFNKPEVGRKLSLFLQGKNTIFDVCYTGKDGRFKFQNLDIRENSMARVQITKDKAEKKKGVLGLGLTFDKGEKRPSFPINSLQEREYNEDQMQNLIDFYKGNVDAEQREMDSLRRRYGQFLLEGVTITEKVKMPGSWNRSRAVPDLVLDSTEITHKYDAYTDVVEILMAEIPGLQYTDEAVLDAAGRKRETHQYKHYVLDGKNVFFQVDAEILSASVSKEFAKDADSFTATNAEDGEYARTEWLEEALRSIAGREVRSIEVLTSHDNVFHYNGARTMFSASNPNDESITTLDSDGNVIAAVIVITTKAGRGTREAQKTGVFLHQIRGGSVPKKFYVPKYYPADIYEQSMFDMRSVLYWNPNVGTDEKGEIEFSFPVGPYMKNNLQIEIEGSDMNGHFGSSRQYIRVD